MTIRIPKNLAKTLLQKDTPVFTDKITESIDKVIDRVDTNDDNYVDSVEISAFKTYVDMNLPLLTDQERQISPLLIKYQETFDTNAITFLDKATFTPDVEIDLSIDNLVSPSYTQISVDEALNLIHAPYYADQNIVKSLQNQQGFIDLDALKKSFDFLTYPEKYLVKNLYKQLVKKSFGETGKKTRNLGNGVKVTTSIELRTEKYQQIDFYRNTTLSSNPGDILLDVSSQKEIGRF